MTESRYKIEYVQPEPVKEQSFRFFGVLGYLWLALLASVLTYGFVYKHISTDEIITYFQKFTTGVVNTNISDLAETSNKTEVTLYEEGIDNEIAITKQNERHNDSLENTDNTQRLVSEVVKDNELPEDVVFESVSIEETASNTTQAQETESIVKEIIKEQNKQEIINSVADTSASIETTETIESATTAIENEIEKTESTVETAPKVQQAFTEEKIAINENINTEEKTEKTIKTLSIEEQKTAKNTAKADESVDSTNILNDGKKELVQVKDKPTKTLSELAKIAVSTPNKNDLSYIKAVTNYETNKIANSDYLEKITAEESKLPETTNNSIQKPENSDISAVDAIIAAMNVDKAAKEKPPMSFQEKTQTEINKLLKNIDQIQSTSQLNN